MRLKSILPFLLLLLPITLGVRVAAQPTATPGVILYPTGTARPRTATPRVTNTPTHRPLTTTATRTPSATASLLLSATPTLTATASSTDSPVIPLTEAATSVSTDAATPVLGPVVRVFGTGDQATEPVTSTTDVASPEAFGTASATEEPGPATTPVIPEPIDVATEPPTPAASARVGVLVFQDKFGDHHCDANAPVAVGEPVEFTVSGQTYQVRTNNDGLALAGEFPSGTIIEARYAGQGTLTGPAQVRLVAGDDPPCAFGLSSLPSVARSGFGIPLLVVLAGGAAVVVVLGIALYIAFRQSN